MATKRKVPPERDPTQRARDATLAELVEVVAGDERARDKAREAEARRPKGRSHKRGKGGDPRTPEQIRATALANLAKATAASAAGAKARAAARDKAGVWASTRALVTFTQRLLSDKDYQAALRKRIIAGEAPSIEILLYQYAYGKPVERVQVEQRGAVTIIDRLSGGGDMVVVGKGATSASHHARVGAVAESAADDGGGGGALRNGGPGGQDDGGVPPGVAGLPEVSGDRVVPESGDG